MAELTINTADIAEALRKNLEGFKPDVETAQVGRVTEVGDGIANVSGLPGAAVNELLEFGSGAVGLALNLDEESIGCVARARGEARPRIVAGDIVDCSAEASAAGNDSVATAEFFGERLDRGLDVIRAGQSIQRTLGRADVAGTIAWLISDGSQFVTGQTIAVDGGTVML